TALSIGTYFKHLLSLNLSNNTVTHSKLDDIEENRNRTCHISLDGYTMKQGRNFSTKRDITITEKTKLNVKLDFKDLVFDAPVSFPFTIPKTYKEK
ncbi:MAG TPA: DUF4292 domain-containing protein, partial [Phnomibacter sp.]|nr:DUF4292 domain-containing protein [Phnomibacter sp.]